MNEKKKKINSNESKIHKRIKHFENLKSLQNLKCLKNLKIFKFSHFFLVFDFYKQCSDQKHLANLAFYTEASKN